MRPISAVERTMQSLFVLAWTAAGGLALGACGGDAPAPNMPTAASSAAVSAATSAPAAPPDPLGPKPDVATPAPYAPPVPVVFRTAGGLTVWLVERHTVPFVAVAITVPSGSASDPKGAGGLAFATANMLDEGAGTRGAIELSRAVDTLGATLSTNASADASTVSLTVIKRNLAPAFAILGDVVARPRFDAAEWNRMHDLWLNDLKQRASDPDDVSRVVTRAALFGADHPYGHPVDGTTATARVVSLDAVKRFYRDAWRPDRAVLVAVGDVTKGELTPMLDAAFASWKTPASRAPQVVTPPAPEGPWPRAVLVDRADAPQSVIALVRPGVAVSDPDAALLTRVNGAFGGSFTSRLNQDLREEHGWSYGAFSRLSASRGKGSLVASAAVFTDKTGEALKALLADIDVYAKQGLTDEEVAKTRQQARADLVEAFESAPSAAGRFANDAALGLGEGYEASASLRRDAATKDELSRLAGAYYDASHAIVVIVGPRAKLEPKLAALGFDAIEIRDADGNVTKKAR